jgi:CRP-like cAMP-binding protein
MYVPCVDCRLRQKAFFRAFSAAELQAMLALKSSHLALPAKTDVLHAGESGGPLCTIYEGWAFRYEQLPGGARQIFDLLLPGDLIGLSAALLGTARHSVQTLTPVSLCVLQGMPIGEFLGRHAELAMSLLRWRAQEEHRADQRLAALGRRRPSQRLAYFMLETFDRLRAREMATGTMCPLPLQRQHLADATGLSMIHLNRTLAQLRDEKLAIVEDKTLVIFDRKRLAELAGYATVSPPLPHPLL